MQIWCYTAHLMGAPDALLFSSEIEAREIFRVGYICEPPLLSIDKSDIHYDTRRDSFIDLRLIYNF